MYGIEKRKDYPSEGSRSQTESLKNDGSFLIDGDGYTGCSHYNTEPYVHRPPCAPCTRWRGNCLTLGLELGDMFRERNVDSGCSRAEC
jgi:hypothetical protein